MTVDVNETGLAKRSDDLARGDARVDRVPVVAHQLGRFMAHAENSRQEGNHSMHVSLENGARDSPFRARNFHETKPATGFQDSQKFSKCERYVGNVAQRISHAEEIGSITPGGDALGA